MLTNARNVPVPPKGLKLVLMTFTQFILGIPSPFGRLRPRAFMAFMGMDREIQRLTTDLKASQANNDFILAKNKAQHDQIEELAAKYREAHADLVKMSKALKELANHPNVLGPDSQAVVNAFKIKH